MAILQAPASDSRIDLFDIPREPLPPAGTFPAVVLATADKLNVTRPKFQSEETEVVNLTAFLFGFRDAEGAAWKIDTRPMRISGHPKSALYRFLVGLLGRSPEYGMDTATLKGTRCLLTVAHVVSQSGTKYAAITSAVPLPAGWAGASKRPAAVSPAPPPPPAPVAVGGEDDCEIPF